MRAIWTGARRASSEGPLFYDPFSQIHGFEAWLAGLPSLHNDWLTNCCKDPSHRHGTGIALKQAKDMRNAPSGYQHNANAVLSAFIALCTPSGPCPQAARTTPLRSPQPHLRGEQPLASWLSTGTPTKPPSSHATPRRRFLRHGACIDHRVVLLIAASILNEHPCCENTAVCAGCPQSLRSYLGQAGNHQRKEHLSPGAPALPQTTVHIPQIT